jgi:RNA polymerase sigma factor (sigma-70 family)
MQTIMATLHERITPLSDRPAPLSTSQFEAAYSSYFHQTVNYLRARGSSREWAEELAQAAWARGWECRAQLKDAAAVQSWVIAIARNLRNLDFRNARSTELLTENSATVQPDPRPLFLQQILRPLSRSDRALLVATYVNGCTSRELGPLLGISPVAVRVRVARAKSSVRNGIRKTATRRPALTLSHSV